ncbi:hypothetical protein FNV43_RR04539 [Rhamnella rubrinervis]|uniref:Uncharacterized protein n=1 Tax=Rhamnella rubrinervis TaxID=2594499 RepID=A0A8K0HJY3_9ROSA|nr:hypothetical protein FNV43_RR04539 [Rhamnella rubrinervis]
MKPSKEGRYTLYIRRQIRLFEDALTSDKNWKDHYFFIKREGIFGPIGMSESESAMLGRKEGCIRLLYSEPSLRASYFAADMGKLKIKMPSKIDIEELQKKKKKVALKSGKEKQAITVLELEDSLIVRTDSALVGPIVDALMNQHNHSILHKTPFEEINLESEQCALKLAQNSCYLYEALIKANNVYRKKDEAYNNVLATKKTFEEDNLSFKKAAIEATNRAE